MSTNRARVIHYLTGRGFTGATWQEAADALHLHHGSVSGALSAAHREGDIVRLAAKRDGLAVYVAPDMVGARTTRPYVPRRRSIEASVEAVAFHYGLSAAEVQRRLCQPALTIDAMAAGTVAAPTGTIVIDRDDDRWTLCHNGRWGIGFVRNPHHDSGVRTLDYVRRHYGPLRIGR